MYSKDRSDILKRANVRKFSEIIDAVRFEDLQDFYDEITSKEVLREACDDLNLTASSLQPIDVKNENFVRDFNAIKTMRLSYGVAWIPDKQKVLTVEYKEKGHFFNKKYKYIQQDAMIAIVYLKKKIDNLMEYINETNIFFLEDKTLLGMKMTLNDIMELHKLLGTLCKDYLVNERYE